MVAASSGRTPAFLTALGTAGKMPALLVFRVVIIVRCTVDCQVERGLCVEDLQALRHFRHPLPEN
jgi:hypothetical protein